MKEVNNFPPQYRPGSRVSTSPFSVGTTGPFAVTKKGDIVMVFTDHQARSGGHGSKIILEERNLPPKNEIYSYDLSFRCKGIKETLPAVLKEPISPKKGMTLIKSGANTGVTEGSVLDPFFEYERKVSGKIIKSLGIKTQRMSEKGDSGGYSLTKETLQPIGIICAGDKNGKYSCHVSLEKIATKNKIKGFFAPITLPYNCSKELEFITSSIIPDGFFYQKTPFPQDESTILKKLGVIGIHNDKKIGFQVEYRDLISCKSNYLNNPKGDIGSFFTSEKGIIGLEIGGNTNVTWIIKISKILDAFNLSLFQGFSKKALAAIHLAGYWRTRCLHCSAIGPPGGICKFCNSPIPEETTV